MSLNYMSTKPGQVQPERRLMLSEAQTRPLTTRAKFILSERSESKGSG